MKSRRLSVLGLSVVGLLLLGARVVRGGDPGQDKGPTLGNVVPSGVHFFASWRATPERRQLLEPYARALRDLVKSGIGHDIFDLATMDLEPERREEAKAMVLRFLEIVRTPRWKELLSDEVSVSFRLAVPVPEYLILFRVPKESASDRRGEFRKVFAAIAELTHGALAVTDSSRRGAEFSRLEVMGAPIALVAASRDTVVALSTSEGILDGVFDLMDAKEGCTPIVKDPRFVAGLEEIGPAENTQVFFDFPGYMGFVDGMLGMAAGVAQSNPDAAGGLSILRTIVDEFGKLGPIVTTESIDGNAFVTRTKVGFVRKDGDGFFEGMVRDQEPIRDFARIVPKDARAFFLSSGIDLLKIHDALVGLVRERVPHGPAALQFWEGLQAQAGFNLRDDLLSWIEGGFGWVVLPRSTSGVEWVFFLRIRNDEKAREILHKGFSRVKDFLASRGQQMDLVEVPVLGTTDFREMRLAAFPRCRPIIGLPKGAFVIGSSIDAVKRVGATFTGEAPNFRENPACAALKVPDGPVSDIYYSDLRGSMECLATLMSGGGFVLSILPANHDTRHARKMGAILTKLSDFVRQVDLGLDSGGWTQYDPEKHAIYDRQFMRIKPGQKDF